MEKTKRYCLCIDPQMQASNWLKRQYASLGMITTKMTDGPFKRTIEIAIDLGKMVMIENVGERVDVHVESLIRKEITKFGDQRMIKLCRRQLKYDPNFHMIMVTSLGKPHYDVNITNHITLINFFVTVEGLTQNLLSMVVANERKDLEESYNDNMKATFDNIKSLKTIENQIL